MVNQPFIGAGYFIRGLKLLASPGIRRFVVIPLAINVSVFALLLGVIGSQFSALIDAMLPTLPDWLSWLSWLYDFFYGLLWSLFAFTAALLIFFSFSIIANLIAAPFNSLLAEAIEKQLTGQPLPGGDSLGIALRKMPSAMVDELGKLGYYLLWALPLLLLFWIPIINLAAPFLWALFSAWMMAVTYADYPMGNHALKGKAQRAHLRSARLASLGFGGLTLLATLVPVFNFMVMPTAVAGGTLFWHEKLKGNKD